MLFTLVLNLLFLVSVQCKQNSLYHLKTYSVPCNPSTYCSHVELLISVNEFESSDCLFKLELIAYNDYSNIPHSVQFSFVRQDKSFNYICSKYEFGGTSSKAYIGQKVYQTGSSIYMNGNLICSWIAQPFLINQSDFGFQISDLIYNTNYSLVVKMDNVESIVTQDSSDLPWHQPGYISCGGYQIYGNDEYRVRIKKGTEQVQLWLESPKQISKKVVVSLTHRNHTRLILVCNYFELYTCAYIDNLDRTRFITEYRNLDDTCTVIIPMKFECADSYCFIANSTFDLSILTNGEFVYAFRNLNLSNQNSGSTFFSSDFYIILSFLSVIPFLRKNKL